MKCIVFTWEGKKNLPFLWPLLSSNLGRMINSAQQRENRKNKKCKKNEESIKEDGSFVMICMKLFFFYVLFFYLRKNAVL